MIGVGVGDDVDDGGARRCRGVGDGLCPVTGVRLENAVQDFRSVFRDSDPCVDASPELPERICSLETIARVLPLVNLGKGYLFDLFD